MIRLLQSSPMWAWAAAQWRRHPVQAGLLFAEIALLTAVIAVGLLLSHCLTAAAARLIDQAPAVVVRRVGAGGWMPLPVDQALESVRAIPGVIDPRPRIWGALMSDEGPVTVVGVSRAFPEKWPGGQPPPTPGAALVGSGIRSADVPGSVTLRGARPMTFAIAGRLPRTAGLAAHDLVLLTAADARQVLGMQDGYASDLALDIFHEEEIPALSAELAQAFPWPVRIVTRSETRRHALADIERRAGLGLVAAVPAILALVMMVLAVGLRGRAQVWEAGLLKSMGWSGQDILGLRMRKALLVGAPAVAVGWAVAYSALFWPGMTWAARALFDWSGPAPALYLTPSGAFGALAAAGAVVGVPFALAAFVSAWSGVTADPADLLEGGSG